MLRNLWSTSPGHIVFAPSLHNLPNSSAYGTIVNVLRDRVHEWDIEREESEGNVRCRRSCRNVITCMEERCFEEDKLVWSDFNAEVNY